MTSKIFKSIVSVAVAAITACLLIITGVLYNYFGNLQQTQLKDELSLAANAVEQLGEDYLENLDSDRYRLTWVSEDGTVIFDSRADVVTMENHKSREEIAQAFKNGHGSSIRHSTTLTEETIYEAVLLDDGSVLRISVSRLTALVLIRSMAQPIALVLVIAIALSAWLARRMAMRIVEPMNRLNLEKPLENEAYEELSPLLRRIHAQHQEIKQQMLTLKQKQDEFDQITGNMKEVMILLDNNGRIIRINPAAKKLYDVHTDCTGEDFFTIDRKQDMRFAINDAKEKGYSYFQTKRNGRDYHCDISRIDFENKMRGLVVLAFDVTEQVNAEKHRREFTANVSHELKTPLQTIIGSAELMEIGIVKEEDMPRFVKTIRREATRLVSLIDDIIRLSQLDEGAEMPVEDVSLKAVAEEVKETLSDSARLKNISVELTGEDGVIKGVRRLLYEVVYNLCDNAIKYNKSGGWVKIAVEEADTNVKISVSDNGMGIPSEHHDKVFERFYRVDKSHSKQSGGTGLGLSIVKHAVQYHHGKISIESQLNVGTTISVVFDKAMG